MNLVMDNLAKTVIFTRILFDFIKFLHFIPVLAS
jgi:hypothetical protein